MRHMLCSAVLVLLLAAGSEQTERRCATIGAEGRPTTSAIAPELRSATMAELPSSEIATELGASSPEKSGTFTPGANAT